MTTAIEQAAEALRALYDDCAEYIRINNLCRSDGSSAINNQVMRQAHDALARLTAGRAAVPPDRERLAQKLDKWAASGIVADSDRTAFAQAAAALRTAERAAVPPDWEDRQAAAKALEEWCVNSDNGLSVAVVETAIDALLAEPEAEIARLTAAYGTASRGFAEAQAEIARLTAEQSRVPPDQERLAQDLYRVLPFVGDQEARAVINEAIAALRLPALAECEEMARRVENNYVDGITGKEAASLIRRLAPTEWWRPIESAPKDAYELVLLSDGKTVEAGEWMPHDPDVPYSEAQWSSGLIPTHWKPLPCPPAEEKT
jgi:hypothetical protein